MKKGGKLTFANSRLFYTQDSYTMVHAVFCTSVGQSSNALGARTLHHISYLSSNQVFPIAEGWNIAVAN